MYDHIDWLDTTPKPMVCPSPQSVNYPSDESLERLVGMTNATCLIALDKTLAAIGGCRTYDGAAKRCHEIADRMVRAVREVGLNLPTHQRVRRHA